MIVSNKIVIVCQGVGNHCPSALIKTGSTKERLHGIALSMGWARQGDNYYCPSCLITVTLMAEPASDPTPELRERGVTLTAEDLADLDDMELHFSNQDTHPRWSRYRRLVTRLFNDDALKGDQK